MLRQYALDHPDDTEGIRRRVDAVLAVVPPDSQQARRAKEFLTQNGVRHEQALGAASLRLRTETEQSIAAGDYDAALRKLADYRGPLAPDTAELRQELADHVRQARDAKSIGSVKRAFETLLDGVARDLAGGAAAAAQKRLRAAQGARNWDLMQADVELAQKQAGQLAELNQRLSDTFMADKDHEIAVEFKNGKSETLLIVGAGPQGVRARRHYPQGYAERNFALGELSVRERLKRIGNDPGPVPCLMRGLIARDGGDRAAAAQEFQQANCALGNALLRMK